jgi:putative transposase
MSVEPCHPRISVSRQCELLGLHRSSFYYKLHGDGSYNQLLMRLIDEVYTRTPFYGAPKITEWLRRQGHEINHKRVERLMAQMGLRAVVPRKRRRFEVHCPHRVYPYLLRGLEVTHPNQVWAADITYLRMGKGFLYLVAILDWHSRYVVSWELSNTLAVEFCLSALEKALSSKAPEIFNTDQGVQFTSEAFTGKLEGMGIAISMDGRRRAFDNIFVERLWRSVKYEEVYLHEYGSVREAREGLDRYLRFYNEERLHQSLEYRTPREVYYGHA